MVRIETNGCEIWPVDAYKALPTIPADSIDIIVTDPPYVDHSLHTYSLLAAEAVRVLKPGGYLWTYCGAMFLPRVFQRMDVPGLDWFWQFREHHSGGFARMFITKTLQAGKPLLVYTKGRPSRMAWLLDEFRGGSKAKKNHPWEQNLHVPLEVLRRLCLPGETVLDPFCGSGTTLVAAVATGLRGIGIEIDAQTAWRASRRVAAGRPCPLLRAQYGQPLTLKGL